MPRLAWSQRPAPALSQDSRLAAEWDRLSATRGDLAFLSAAAIGCALDVFGDGRERLMLGHDGAELVAVFVLVDVGGWQWRTFQPSQLPLGAWVADARLPLAGIAASLIRAAFPPRLMLSVTRIDPLLAERTADLAGDRHDDYIETAWIDIAGTLDAYWAERGKNLRQNMRKQRNKLAAEGVVPRMRTLTQPAEMAGAVERYGKLESSGWKGGEGSAVHPDNPQGRFYQRLLESAAERGEAMVYEYLFDERSVAINLCLRRDGTLVILKTTYDESIKAYSPAFLLHQDMVEQWFTTPDTRRVEYYGSLMDWHTKWTDKRRWLHHLTVYRWPLAKTAAEAWRRRRPALELQP